MNVVPSPDFIPASPSVPESISQTPPTPFMEDLSHLSWYQNKENLYTALQHYLAIFSEGGHPVVPLVGKVNGSPLDVRATLELPCYDGFPADEKLKWLA